MEIDTACQRGDQRGTSTSFPSLFADVDSLLYKHKPMTIEEGGRGEAEDDEDCTEATTQFGDETSSFLSGVSAASDTLAETLSGLVLVDLDEAEEEEAAATQPREEPSGCSIGTISPIPSCSTSDEESDDDAEVFPPCTFPDPPQRRDSSSLPSTTVPRRSSLRRESLSSENLHIHTRRGCWKVLPAPDLATIKTSRSLSCLASASAPTTAVAAEGHDSGTSRRRRAVSFGEVHMRSYEQTLGDNPSVSYGPPISLDWRFLELPSLSLDQYEATKKAPRKPREMVLNYYNRKHLLAWKFGFSEDDLKRASRDANRCKRERAVTRALLGASKLEDLFESARRKAVRRVSGATAGTPLRDASK